MRLFGRKSNSDTPATPSSDNPPEAPVAAPAATPPVASNSQSVPFQKTEPVRIPRAKLEKSRRELKTLLFEKDLVSSALTRLYEAEASGEITKDERETLAVKYRVHLKDLDSQIQKIDAFIEVGDLEVLRDQLVELVRQKIEQIEKRIERNRPLAQSLLETEEPPKKTNPVKPAVLEPEKKPRVPDISNLLDKESPSPPKPVEEEPKELAPVMAATTGGEISEPQVATETPRPRKKLETEASTDDEVDSLQRELKDALDKLEKLDLES